jgi:hypothetical protein
MYWYRIGAIEKAGKIFTKLVKKNKLSGNPEYEEYTWCLNQAMSENSNVVLTTHALALAPSLKVMGAKVLIIDEDCINTLFYPSEILIKDIQLLLEIVETFNKTDHIQEWLKKTIDEIRYEVYLQSNAIGDKEGASFVGAVHPVEPVKFSAVSIVKKVTKMVEKGGKKFPAIAGDGVGKMAKGGMCRGMGAASKGGKYKA